jgi:hypothetical protein
MGPAFVKARESQRDVVYFGSPIAPLVCERKWGGGGVAGSPPMSTAVHKSTSTWRPNKLWSSNSTFNLYVLRLTLLPLFSGEGLQAVVPSNNNNNRKAAPASGQGGRPASPEAGIVNQGFHTEEAAEGHTGGVSDPAPALPMKPTGARPKHSGAASGSSTASLAVTGQG